MGEGGEDGVLRGPVPGGGSPVSVPGGCAPWIRRLHCPPLRGFFLNKLSFIFIYYYLFFLDFFIFIYLFIYLFINFFNNINIYVFFVFI